MRRLADLALGSARLRGAGWRLILNYHDVSPADAPQHSPHHSTTPEVFEEQLDAIAAGFEVVSLPELLAATGPSPSGRPMAAIGFDDGFRSVADRAEPALRRRGLPFAIFLTVSAVEQGRLPVAELAAGERSAALVEAAYERLRPPVALEEFARDPVAFVADFSALDGFADHLAPDPRSRPLFLDEAGVRDLVARGAHVGSHALTHRVLSHCTPEQMREEIGTARERLRALTGAEVESLAVPFGKAAHHGPAVWAAAQDAGHGSVLSSDPEAWSSQHPPAAAHPRLSLLGERGPRLRAAINKAALRALRRGRRPTV
ncbi:MAG: polysaccharide deacetylase [Solirubrobacterales bacterium]|nr:polysaccharide deacetylase [Solirubrobacterales bacterium]